MQANKVMSAEVFRHLSGHVGLHVFGELLDSQTKGSVQYRLKCKLPVQIHPHSELGSTIINVTKADECLLYTYVFD